ncbi:MAG: RNA polymerase sigma factor [Rubripirellula sp.]
MRDGDEMAASTLYDRYARRVLGLVKKKLGARLSRATEPEDVVQSVFKSMFRGVQSGNYQAPPGETLWNLLAVISVNKLNRQANYHSAQCRDLDRAVQLDSASAADLTDSPSLERFEMLFRETLEELAAEDLDIVSLRIEGHSIAEIAGKTGITRRSVERRLQKTRERFTDELLE